VLSPTRAWVASPALFLHRTGVALLIGAALAALGNRGAWLEPIAKRALTLYVGHLVVL
jgi:hypothetical protein